MNTWKRNGIIIIVWIVLFSSGALIYALESYQFNAYWDQSVPIVRDQAIREKERVLREIAEKSDYYDDLNYDGMLVYRPYEFYDYCQTMGQLFELETTCYQSLLQFQLPIPTACSFELVDTNTNRVVLDDSYVLIKNETNSDIVGIFQARDVFDVNMITTIYKEQRKHKPLRLYSKRLNVYSENRYLGLKIAIPEQIALCGSSEKKEYKVIQTLCTDRGFSPHNYVLLNTTFCSDSKLYENAYYRRTDAVKYEVGDYYVTQAVGQVRNYSYRICLVLDDMPARIWFHVILAIVLLLVIGVMGLFFTMTIGFTQRRHQYERELTNAIAHDMKSGLMVISGYAENLISGVDEETKTRYEAKIMEETIGLNNTVERMLTMSRVKKKKTPIKLSEVNVDELVTTSLQRYEDLLQKRGLTVTRQTGTFVITTDAELLEIAIDNYMSNAVKYATENSVINISTLNHRFEITNLWLPVRKFQKHPQKFWQAYVTSSEARTSGTGTGLGLSIAANILKKLKLKYGVIAGDDAVSFWIGTK